MMKRNKKVFVLIAAVLLMVVFTFSVRFLKFLPSGGLRIAGLVGLNLLNGTVALVALRLSGLKVCLDFRNWRQYAVGVVLALILSLCIAVIPSFFGLYLVGGGTAFSLTALLYDFFFYLLVIGPVEELMFRVYLQELFMDFLSQKKWLGVVLASLLFGLYHWINGNWVQVIFTFGIGLYFGFAKYKLKNCCYTAVALGHGLYDFLNTVVRMFLI